MGRIEFNLQKQLYLAFLVYIMRNNYYLLACKKNLFSFFFLMMINGLLAQMPLRLQGKVSSQQQGLEFVSISLALATDSNRLIRTTTSDSLGMFLFDNLGAGNYLVTANAMGYQPLTKQISLSSENKAFQDFQLQAANHTLSEVLTSSRKKSIEKTNQGFVVNVGSNITQLGGTATDLLQSTPTIAVDGDGVITLRGKAPLILINGRNSNVSNPNQIPASSVESIEIINNASAKYDAHAESGIINIKLKKNKQNGLNGAVALGAGFGARARVNSSFLLNYKTEKWNWALAYDNRFAGRTKRIAEFNIQTQLF